MLKGEAENTPGAIQGRQGGSFLSLQEFSFGLTSAKVIWVAFGSDKLQLLRTVSVTLFLHSLNLFPRP